MEDTFRADIIIGANEMGPVEQIYVQCPKRLSGVPSFGSGLLSSDILIIKLPVVEYMQLW